ncbi:hypothetical protein BDV12DRAFT_172530 [Aspergillus spectabilis]
MFSCLPNTSCSGPVSRRQLRRGTAPSICSLAPTLLLVRSLISTSACLPSRSTSHAVRDLASCISHICYHSSYCCSSTHWDWAFRAYQLACTVFISAGFAFSCNSFPLRSGCPSETPLPIDTSQGSVARTSLG